MKKRHILFLLTALILIAVSIISPLTTRIAYEKQHTGYVTAISLNDLSTQFDNAKLPDVLKAYKQSGMQAGVLHIKHGKADTSLLAQAKETGLETALVLYADTEYTESYVSEIKTLATDYSVGYILLKEADENKNIEALSEIFIGTSAPILVLCENESQLSNENPLGTETCIKHANGRIMRAYETKKAPGGDADTIYYQMMNSARDRNTEFLLINQRTDVADNPYDNASATQKATEKFCAWMDKAGYSSGFSGALTGYDAPRKSISAVAAALSVLMLIFMMHVLFGAQNPSTDWLLFAFAILACGATYLMPEALLVLYPPMFAIVSACFSLTLTMYVSDKAKQRLPLIGYMPLVLCTALVSLLVCCSVLSAMLSGAEYYLNIRIFRGVGITLIVPLLYAAFLFFVRTKQKPSHLLSFIKQLPKLRKQIKLWHIVFGAALLGIVALYLIRSGNANISPLEKSIRNFMAEFSMARPRTKEFLIGWPALALLLYATKQKHETLLTLLFTLGASIVFASVMNTFCHVFADFTTSLIRTLNGVLFALPVMIACCSVFHLFQKHVLRK